MDGRHGYNNPTGIIFVYPSDGEKSFDWEVQVDVYVPSGSIVSMCPFGERQDISNAFCVSLSQSEEV